MLEQFLNHIELHQLCKTTDKILLAVSGGVDSMVMLDLFKEAGYDIGVAHCNFQLRGENSLADEVLVNRRCVDVQVPFHVRRFNTKKIAEEQSLSIQLAARELRYQFFREIADEDRYTIIATAHHLDDSLETAILNLARGTGIKGISGIPIKTRNVIRPMLFATRQMILDYAVFRRIEWREDESNASDDYQRNFVRHQIVPKLREINPRLEQTFGSTAERLSAAGKIFQSYCRKMENEAVRSVDGTVTISTSAILSSAAPAVVLAELVGKFGFQFIQCKEIVKPHQAGKKFLTNTYELAITSDSYLIRRRVPDHPAEQILVDQETASADNGHQSLNFYRVPMPEFELNMSSSVAQLDFNKLTFPLVWRKWKPGDVFMPLGMNSMKKVSDFLIDSKISSFEKDRVTVLESKGEIVWVVNHRISEKFKVSSGTSVILVVS